MRWRKPTKPTAGQPGFTIVEVMIVLAVTGLMFVSVAIIISGKQQAAQFQSAVNNMRSQISQVSNEVDNGTFSDDNGLLDCSVSFGNIQLRHKSAGTKSSGKCNYLGKVLHFYDASTGSSDKFSVYTVLGVDGGAGGYGTAKPLLAAPTRFVPGSGTLPNPGDLVDTTDDITLGYGLSAVGMQFTDTSGTNRIGSFGFIQSVNANLDSSNTGGSQHLNLVAFPSTTSTLDNNKLDEATAVDSAFDGGNFKTEGTVDICFKSGATNQFAKITIGVGASKLDVTSKIEDTKTCI